MVDPSLMNLSEKKALLDVVKILHLQHLEFCVTGMKVLLLRFSDLPRETHDLDVHVIWKDQYHSFVWDQFSKLYRRLVESLKPRGYRLTWRDQNIIMVRGFGSTIEITTHPDLSPKILDFCEETTLDGLNLRIASNEVIIFGKLLRHDQVKDVPILRYLFLKHRDKIDFNRLEKIIDSFDQHDVAFRRYQALLTTVSDGSEITAEERREGIAVRSDAFVGVESCPRCGHPFTDPSYHEIMEREGENRRYVCKEPRR